MSSNKQNNLYSEFLIFAIFVFAFVIAPIIDAQSFITRILTPALFLIYSIKGNFKNIFEDKALVYYTAFTLSSLFSIINVLYSTTFNFDAFISVSLIVIFTYLFILLILAILKYKPERIYTFFIIYVTTLIIMFIYVYYLYNADIYMLMSNRLSDANQIFNANTYGYFAIFAFFSSIYLDLRFNVFWSKLLIIITLLLGLLIIVFSASRGGLISFLIAIISLFIGNMFIKKKSLSKRLLQIFSILIFGVIAYLLYNYILENTFLGMRISSVEDYSGDYRISLAKEALSIGIESPVYGIGAGQFGIINKTVPGVFSHNSYTEIFVNYGIITLIIYFLIHFSIFKKTLRLWKSKNVLHKKFAMVSLVFIIVFMVYNLFYVMYLAFSLILFLFLVNELVKSKLKENKL